MGPPPGTWGGECPHMSGRGRVARNGANASGGKKGSHQSTGPCLVVVITHLVSSAVFFFSRQPLERKAKVPKEKGKERPNNNCSMAECCCMPVGVWLKSSEK